MFKRFLNFETKSINGAAVILAVSALISGLLGLLRDRLLAGSFGAGDELDIYYSAFRIPDFISTILIIGSISAAIIPIFSEYLSKSKEEAWYFFGNLLNCFFVLLIIISALMMIFVPQILHLVVPGFSGEKFDKTVELTRIMFLSPIILGISNMVSGVLRIFGRFVITSISPILYNLGIILGILIFVPIFKLEGLAWGVVFGAFLHLIIQIPIILKLGFKPVKFVKFSDPGVRKTIKLTLPRTLGLAANQINLIVITAIGSMLSVGSIGIFNLASNLQSLPITFIANSFSSAAFPFLAVYFSEKKRDKFVSEFSSVFRQIFFYVIPASFIIFILRAQIIRVVLGTGRFTWGNTQITAACLGLFSIGIFADSLSLLISKAFYALQNTKIPAIVAFLNIIVNVILSFFFLWLLGFSNFFSNGLLGILDIENIGGNIVVALPLALSCSSVIELTLLLVLFVKKSKINIKEIAYFCLKVIFAGLALGISTILARNFVSGFVDMKSFWGVSGQLIASFVVGGLVFALIAHWFRLPEIMVIKQLFLKKPRKLQNLSETP
jgi:putative peptidoglycan lipid II flippase